MPPHGGGGRGGCSAPPPGGRGGCSAQSPGGRGSGRGGASATFEVPIFRGQQAVHFKAPNSRRGRARKSRRGRSGRGPSKGRPQSPPCQDHVAEQTPVSCSSKLLGTLRESPTTTTCLSNPQALLPDTTEISASSGRCLSSSPGPTILVRKHPDWYLEFYIRMDRSDFFHTYPDVGGPYNSLQDAENAIDDYLHGLEHKKMCKESLDKLSPMDWLIQRSLYWPDGSRRKCSEASVAKNTDAAMGQLLRALVDNYNEDPNRSEDHAYELKDVLHYQTMRDGNIWYSHFNFTAKAKGAGGIDLFFAEVIQGHEMVVNYFCMIDTDANGPCYGCTNNGSVDMRHPNKSGTYNAGHPGAYLLSYRTGKWDVSDDDGDVNAEVVRLRRIYKGLDDPEYLMKISTSPHATATCIED